MTNEKVKQWCKAHKITQGELAKQMGYSEIALRKALNSPAPKTLRMQEALNRVINEHKGTKRGTKRNPMPQDAHTALQETIASTQALLEQLKRIAATFAPQDPQK